MGRDFNLSRYVLNSPNNLVDPFGHMAMAEYLGTVSNPLNRGSMALIGFAQGISFFTFNYLAELLNSGNCKSALNIANAKSHAMHMDLTKGGSHAKRAGLSLINNFASGVGIGDFEDYKIFRNLAKYLSKETKDIKYGGFGEGYKYAYNYFSPLCND